MRWALYSLLSNSRLVNQDILNYSALLTTNNTLGLNLLVNHKSRPIFKSLKTHISNSNILWQIYGFTILWLWTRTHLSTMHKLSNDDKYHAKDSQGTSRTNELPGSEKYESINIRFLVVYCIYIYVFITVHNRLARPSMYLGKKVSYYTLSFLQRVKCIVKNSVDLK